MLLTYSIISIVLICCYLAIIGCYIYYWNRLNIWEIPSDYQARTSVTVIVAARNEEAGIRDCVQALLNQKYPKDLFQICVVNDHSQDRTAELLAAFEAPHLLVLELGDGVGGKKQALKMAIEETDSELIVTTDADCVMDENWLNYLVSCYQESGAKLLAAPVTFHQEKTTFERFQSLDFMGMMAVAGAGIEGRFMNMCNGANLAYQRQAFEAVGGFEGIDHVASGDDMLLMQKIAKEYPGQIAYVKQAKSQTQTFAKPTIKAFVQQRIRWTSKSGAYDGWQVLAMLATVWILCLLMFVDLFLILYNPIFLYLFLGKFILKGIADFFFLGMMAQFFNRRDLMRAFLPALVMHWWYIAFVGTLGNLSKKYDWKGRTVN